MMEGGLVVQRRRAPGSRPPAKPRVLPKLWTEAEMDLLRAGHRLVPGRSFKACESQRHKMKIFIRLPRPKPYTPPPPPASGQLPDPKWWRSAQQMRAAGCAIVDIKEAVGKSLRAVYVALYPQTRKNTRKAKRKYYESRKSDPDFMKKHRSYKGFLDRQRLAARGYARQDWREAGAKPEALESFYRKYDCL